MGKGKFGRIADDDLKCAFEVASIIAIACPPKSPHLCGIETDLSRVIGLDHPFSPGLPPPAVSPVQQDAF